MARKQLLRHLFFLQPAAFLVLVVMATLSSSLPMPDPVQCSDWSSSSTTGTSNNIKIGSDCTVTNYLGVWTDRRTCLASRAIFPTTESQILAAVSDAVRRNISVKVISALSHSLPPLACPRPGGETLIISTRDYNLGLSFDSATASVTADSGVQLRDLVDAAAAAGFALPNVPYWAGLSIGGLLATGASGSSLFGNGGAVHQYLKAMTLVVPASAAEGYAKLIRLTPSDNPDEFDAARVSLGVLGVISKVTLQLEPLFKRSITYEPKPDDDLEQRVLDFAATYEFGDITWHPSLRTAVYRLDKREPATAPGDGVYDFLGFRPIDVNVIRAARFLEETYEATGGAAARCVASAGQVAALLAAANGLKNNAELELGFTGYPVVGYSNRMQTSSTCLTSEEPNQLCAWDRSVPGEFYHQTTVAISADKVSEFIADVKALRDSAAEAAEGLCGVDLYFGVLMRFVKGTTAYLADADDSVHFDITYYRAREAEKPRLLEDVMEEVEQMALFKYGGRPHWGKNRPVAFLDMWRRYPKLARFLSVKRSLDPTGIFSSDWSDAVLGIAGRPLGLLFTDTDGCALDGGCICSKDSHCAPSLGYFCRPGRVYTDARVCRKVN